MWTIDVKILGGRVLSKYIDNTIPHNDEFLYINDIIYKVSSVLYDYNSKYASVLVKES
jgi:hypothetical protein